MGERYRPLLGYKNGRPDIYDEPEGERAESELEDDSGAYGEYGQDDDHTDGVSGALKESAPLYKYYPLYEKHIHHDPETGEYRLRYDEHSEGVPISPRMGRLIKLALAAEEDRIEDHQHETVNQVMRAVNCHKTVLYLLGLISHTQLRELGNTGEDYSFGKAALELTDRPFEHVYDEYTYEQLASNCAENGLCVAQISTDEKGEHLQHSFWLGKIECRKWLVDLAENHG